MIETVINLAGEKEPFDAKKLNHWVQDAVGKFKVDEWGEIALEAIRDLPKEVHVLKLMQSLVDKLLDRDTWSHYLMAGRIMAVMIRMEIYGSKELPTVREVQRRLAEKGLMRTLNYSEYEWGLIEDTINHDLDFTAPHFSLEQIRYKYALQDYAEKQEFETQQYVYMRMAMTIFEKHAETEPGVSLSNDDPSNRSRLEHVIRIYKHFSEKRLSAPTPNYNNLGTYHRGFASCCLVAAGDNRHSLAAADHITYMMTTQSAGLGLNIMTRSIGDAVQKGRFKHRGKKPYIDVFGKNIRANLQGGRGGAGTFYGNLYDPEARMIFGLRDTRAVESKRNRDAHYAFMTNRYLVLKCGRGEQVFSWNVKTAPDLHEAFYGDDIKEFARIYEKYEQDPNFVKNYFDGRDLYTFALNQGVSTGTIYAASIDEMNLNTPFIDPIHSSNLCVAPGTTIVTRLHGVKPISEYQDRSVEIWNGFEWSRVTVRQTSPCEKLLRVYVNAGVGFLDCTEAHKWYIIDKKGNEKEVRTVDLKGGEKLAKWYLPTDTENAIEAQVLDVEDMGVENSTYCFTEHIKHRALFNGIMTGQCLEVSEPTEPYTGPQAQIDLYSDHEVGYAKFKATDASGKSFNLDVKASKVFKGSNGKKWSAGHVKLGRKFMFETVGELTVSEIIDVKKEPEVALCSLAAINYTEEMSDEVLRDVMYYAYKMIDYCILENEYIIPHMGVTAKARMNAGVGMMGLATHMARKRLKYSEKAGLEEIHRVFERHMYFAIEASLQISKERGLAPWIDRTKWPEGWTPLQSYRREVDALGDFVYQYDHEEQRQRIIANRGLAHSCLINFMPGESSSKALGATNSVYGIRDKVLIKVDANNVLRWAAPYSDDPDYLYESMFDTELIQQNSFYAVMQKFCDQTISADWWINFTKNVTISSTKLFDAEVDRVKKGVKTRYYINTLMPKSDDTMKVSKSVHSVDWAARTDAVYKQALNDGFKGNKEEWLTAVRGNKGQAVYLQAVQQGYFNGTEEEWIVKGGYSVVNHDVHDAYADIARVEVDPELRAIVQSLEQVQFDPALAEAGIVFQSDDDDGDGHMQCEGCSL